MRSILPGIVAPASLAAALGFGLEMSPSPRPAAHRRPGHPAKTKSATQQRRGKGSKHAKRMTRLGGNHGR